MRHVVPVFFDFACPWSYAARPREQRLAREVGVEFEYLPWELDASVPADGADNPWAQPGEELRAFAKENGVELRPIPRRFNTRKALLGLFHARAHGRYHEYLDRVLRAFHVEQRNVHDDDVLRELVADVGLEPEPFLESVRTRAHEPYLAAVDALGEKLDVPTTVTYVLPDDAGGRTAHQGLGPTDETRSVLQAAFG